MEFVLEKLSKGFASTSSNSGRVKLSTDSCALIVSSELSVFITASQFSIQALSDLWDSKEGIYGYGTRGKGEYNITNPYVCLLGGSAQEWLVKSIPADAVGGGFTRRVNFVFATKKDKKIAWPVVGQGNKDDLVEDLRSIAQLRGEFVFDQRARPIFEKYYNESEPDDYDDEATANYKTSKWASATKLAMVLCAARGDSMKISVRDFQQAIDKTEEVANDLKLVFRAVGESDLTLVADKVLKFLEVKGYASRHEMMKALWRHVTSEDLDKVLATFLEAGLIGERVQGSKALYFVIASAKGAIP